MSANEMKEIMQECSRLRALAPPGSLRTRKEYERAVQLNSLQIRKLANRFGVSAAVFV